MTPELTCFVVKTWLDGKPDTAVVGKPSYYASCPLAVFLMETTGNPTAHVCANEYWVSHQSNERPAPDWVGRFINLVDRNDDPITAVQAKQYLLEACLP